MSLLDRVCPVDHLPLKPCARCGHAVHDTAPGLPQICVRCAQKQDEARGMCLP